MKIDIKPEPDFARIRKTLPSKASRIGRLLGEFLIDGTIKEAILGVRCSAPRMKWSSGLKLVMITSTSARTTISKWWITTMNPLKAKA